MLLVSFGAVAMLGGPDTITCDSMGCDCTGDVLKRCRFAAAARREIDLSGQQLSCIDPGAFALLSSASSLL